MISEDTKNRIAKRRKIFSMLENSGMPSHKVILAYSRIIKNQNKKT